MQSYQIFFIKLFLQGSLWWRNLVRTESAFKLRCNKNNCLIQPLLNEINKHSYTTMLTCSKQQILSLTLFSKSVVQKLTWLNTLFMVTWHNRIVLRISLPVLKKRLAFSRLTSCTENWVSGFFFNYTWKIVWRWKVSNCSFILLNLIFIFF